MPNLLFQGYGQLGRLHVHRGSSWFCFGFAGAEVLSLQDPHKNKESHPAGAGFRLNLLTVECGVV